MLLMYICRRMYRRMLWMDIFRLIWRRWPFLDCDKVILINHGSSGEKDIAALKRLFKTPAWQNVPAIANGNIEVLPGRCFASVPTARMDQVLLYAEKVLYGQSH